MNNSLIVNDIAAGAIGTNGDININVGSFAANNSFISTSTQGEGNSGNISIKALESILFDSSRIFNTVNDGAKGDSGTIKLDANNIELNNGSTISTSVLGTGKGGEIYLKASNQISISNSFLTSGLDAVDAKGTAGNIRIEADSVFFNQTAISSGTNGQGNAGNILIIGNNLVSLSDRASLNSNVDFNAKGEGGEINIKSNSLSLTDNASINSTTFGQGNSGNIS
ncbi:MAG: hypothetical protein HC907_37190 [Richelia sp. SM1_7_0]|nr:hypothetical protein [Richelia sp. SM1_7_0]